MTVVHGEQTLRSVGLRVTRLAVLQVLGVLGGGGHLDVDGSTRRVRARLDH